jgi:hypothetical protein
VVSLSPKHLPIFTQSTLLSSASLRSNVTVQKKTKAHIPKVPPGATEGGLASFSDLEPLLLATDHPNTISLPGSSSIGLVLTPSPVLRASLLSLQAPL